MRQIPTKAETLRRKREAVRLEIEKARLTQTETNGLSAETLSRGKSYTEWHDYRPDTPSPEWDNVVELAENRFYELILEVLENLLTFYDFQCARGQTDIPDLLAKLGETRSRQDRTAFFQQDGFKSNCRFYWT